jgi:hypothetical protein
VIDYAKLLTLRYPGAQWSLNGATYDDLIWLDSTPKPSQAELDALWPEVADAQFPLSGTPLVATLNAVLGLWTLQQAANIAQLPPEALVAEAEAWAVAGDA